MIPVIDRNYDVNDVMTDNIHVVILGIDLNYDINSVHRANLATSRELHRISGHSPELRYKTLIYMVILVNDLIYDINDAKTANIFMS